VTPTVSVIIPSYNHEKFIKNCINSVLNQTFQDFEIIITDDGSVDRTVEIIKSFEDPRIRLFTHTGNQGASIASNNCITHSNGRYIAMLSSDDVWYPEKLALQVRYLDDHSGVAAVFGKVDWINENGNLIVYKGFPYKYMFEVENRTRHEWLRHFFLYGNCLCHPCSLVRRECYSEVGMFDPAFASLPDLDFWIRICIKYEIAILDQKLIQFRKFSDENNASGKTMETLIRNRLEHRHSLNHYLKINNPDELFLIFPEAIEYGAATPEIIPYFLGRIAIKTDDDYKVLWGLDVIYKLLQDDRNAKILENKCDFAHPDFIKLTGAYDPFKISALTTVTSTKKRTPIKLFLTASKRYAKEIYFILLKFMKK